MPAWLEAIADWILIPAIIIYGFASWAKDNPGKSIMGDLGKKAEDKPRTNAQEHSEDRPTPKKSDRT